MSSYTRMTPPAGKDEYSTLEIRDFIIWKEKGEWQLMFAPQAP